MTFTSAIFLIALLPWFVILYHLLLGGKNFGKLALLFLANSLFYIWGGAKAFIFIFIYSIWIWICCLISSRWKYKLILFALIVISTIPLFWVKYSSFIFSNLNAYTGTDLPYTAAIAPIGVSFFTFQAISLIVDTFRNSVNVVITPLKVYLYLTFFPTITSGPIIRFNEFLSGLNYRKNINWDKAVIRITIGLCKKVIVADKIAVLADYYFDGVAAGNAYSIAGLWIGSIAYTLQLYFDFSGYSDMAIGIGQLLGFTIRENFDSPYQASSISDFWKRWHISLTQWFRDYIYIPLGGNRCAIPRHILNMLIVWLVTGIWHGADWSFILWGLAYFILLIFEKYIPFMQKMSRLIRHCYTLFFINLLWVPFRAADLKATKRYLTGMFGGGMPGIEEKAINFMPLCVLAILLCLPWTLLLKKIQNKHWYAIVRGCTMIFLAFLGVCAMVNSSYSPYIYGNF